VPISLRVVYWLVIVCLWKCRVQHSLSAWWTRSYTLWCTSTTDWRLLVRRCRSISGGSATWPSSSWYDIVNICTHQTQIHEYLSLSGISPPYLADDCHLVANARERRLRSIASRTCVVTRTYSTFGDRAFGAAGPGLWNSLPSHPKDADISYGEFHRSLKTFLFGQWGHGAVWTVLIVPTRSILTYLLTYLWVSEEVGLYYSARKSTRMVKSSYFDHECYCCTKPTRFSNLPCGPVPTRINSIDK